MPSVRARVSSHLAVSSPPQSGEHAAASIAYTRAIETLERALTDACPTGVEPDASIERFKHAYLRVLPTLLCNRALMAAKLQRHDASLRDAEAAAAALADPSIGMDALEADAQRVKALYRQARTEPWLLRHACILRR